MESNVVPANIKNVMVNVMMSIFFWVGVETPKLESLPP